MPDAAVQSERIIKTLLVFINTKAGEHGCIHRSTAAEGFCNQSGPTLFVLKYHLRLCRCFIIGLHHLGIGLVRPLHGDEVHHFLMTFTLDISTAPCTTCISR